MTGSVSTIRCRILVIVAGCLLTSACRTPLPSSSSTPLDANDGPVATNTTEDGTTFDAESTPVGSPRVGARASVDLSGPPPVGPTRPEARVDAAKPSLEPRASSFEPTALASRPPGPARFPDCPNPAVACPPGHQQLDPRAIPDPACQWSPPGIRGPWPSDEYIFDGGDRLVPVEVSRDWTVRGLDTEDTIAHFETLDGGTEVTECNRVPIYAPRFAAVRKVTGASAHEQNVASLHVDSRESAVLRDDLRIPSTVHQPLQPGNQFSALTPGTFLDRTRGLNLDNAQRIVGLVNDFLPYEDFKFIRRGEFENTEKARLAARVNAAVVWSHDLGVQVVIDETFASEASGAFEAGQATHYELPPGKPRLRICKVASTEHALPGEVVDFTIRFDNVGDQLIGNVTIIDNLTGRLEYVADSAQCSKAAEFFTEENEGESLVLRWEITDPLKVNDGGVIRFQCRVR